MVWEAHCAIVKKVEVHDLIERKRSNRHIKKLMCLITALALAITLMPMAAFADSGNSEPTLINSVMVYKVQKPVVGMQSSVKNISTGSGECSTKVYDSYWFDDTDNKPLIEADKFIAGQSYHIVIVVEPQTVGGVEYAFEFDSTADAKNMGEVRLFSGDIDKAIMASEGRLYIESKSVKAISRVAPKSVSVELFNKYNAIKIEWPKVAMQKSIRHGLKSKEKADITYKRRQLQILLSHHAWQPEKNIM